MGYAGHIRNELIFEMGLDVVAVHERPLVELKLGGQRVGQRQNKIDELAR